MHAGLGSSVCVDHTLALNNLGGEVHAGLGSSACVDHTLALNKLGFHYAAGMRLPKVYRSGGTRTTASATSPAGTSETKPGAS